MREMVTVEQVEHLFKLLALALPILGAVVGAIYGSRRAASAKYALWGAMLGLIGILNLALWKVYNRLTDAMGADTVRNLVTNIVLFIAIGAVAGVIVGIAVKRRDLRNMQQTGKDD